MRTTTFRPLISALLAAAVLSGCALAPTYERPATTQPAAFKELQGWAPAAPADALDRGPWWTLFNDPVLDGLVRQVEVSNQNVAAAVAAYSQARALVAQQRASLFPTVTLNGGANRNGSGGGSNDNGNNNGRTSNSFRLNIGSSWEPDVWGRLRAGISAAQANAQASAADLASARLSAQGELAADYFSLRSVDAQRALLATTIEGYQRVLKITQNRFDVGIVPHSDVYQAQTQLASAQSDDLTLARQRAQLEHAIAVLVGKAPADFALAPAQWNVTVPDVPVGVPSTLLERRPDIAASERAVAAANAQIGIVRAAYFPQIGLTASYGPSASAIGDLFKASSMAWALGLSATETIFNGGANRAAVQGADAAREQAVARYRQTVLDAFADVEDQLNATRVLAQQQDLQRLASEAADKVEEQVLNRYKAGQVSYSEVVQAQVTALNARRALVQTQGNRQTTAVALIQSLGGGWHADQLTAQE
ncbi:efflux transporter outer membrane subunit [Telluria mixta]|uniref:Efflux transporter outer membrane subunit n=1 Tax=Telluria mixta TaxID=34071 RepID=A0ABT2BTH7_9BURK|nr:efflux transporter outer membrane subunit [Telluria mixta]MCS0628408.1 efflux transporter outer membrane subunit [Telluria mixta]WEM93485.1 efflux transporter outer membrane subunit [Telluria mixta]